MKKPTSTSAPRVAISLDNLLHNCAQIRSLLPKKTEILAVVKDNAYGCGSGPVAQTLEKQAGVTFFAVARYEEAVFLRTCGVKSPVLILGPVTSAAVKISAQSGFILTLNDLSELKHWSATRSRIRFHCHIDTRMHRLGIQPGETAALAGHLKKNPRLELEGVYTHLANADERGTKTVAQQLALFKDALILLRKEGYNPKHIHYANSAGLMRYPLPDCTLVRPGIALYGCKPDPAQKFSLDLKPVVSLSGSIIKMQCVPAGTPLSYGGDYVTRRSTVIATIDLGYAAGLPRSLGNCGAVLIKGKRLRIAGRITMDYLMADVGQNPLCRVGDLVTAIGRQGSEEITPDDVARQSGTIGYEILTNLHAALDRVYTIDNTVCKKLPGLVF